MPARNEARIIEASLTRLREWRAHGHEVIVVDGSSSDATAALARPHCDRVLQSEPGRARQMNAGAAVARGELFLFLHADTCLPAGAEADLISMLGGSVTAWGRFDVALDAPGSAFRVIETMMNARSRCAGIATGDQGIFVTRALFLRAGGFPPIALMEDIALSSRLRRACRPVCLRTRVTTSARRWQEHGVITTIIEMWLLRLAFFLRVSPAALRAVYERRSARRP